VKKDGFGVRVSVKGKEGVTRIPDSRYLLSFAIIIRMFWYNSEDVKMVKGKKRER
jgi:hypothetical protein